MRVLTESILENKALSPLPSWVEGGSLPALISGLGETARAQLAAALLLSGSRPLVVVTPDESTAEQFRNNLEAFLDRKFNAVLCPGRDFMFLDADTVSRQREQAHLNSLYRLCREKPAVTVVTAAALVQRTVSPEEYGTEIFQLRPGDTVSPEELESRLLNLGYIRADQTEGAGQFSRRGGIFDIYSPAEAGPVRLEFWGDQIDTMSLFDPDSQRRDRDRDLKEISLIPAMECNVNLIPDGPEVLAEKLLTLAGRINPNADRFDPERLKETLEKDAQKLKDQGSLQTADRYMSLLFRGFSCLLDYLSPESLIFIDQPGKCEERISESLKSAMDDLRVLIRDGVLVDRLAAFYMKKEALIQRLADFAVVMADFFTLGKYMLPPKQTTAALVKQLPSYAGSGETAAQDVSHWLASGYRCLVLTADERRAAAMEEFLKGKNIPGVYRDIQLTALPEPGRCCVSVGSLSAGLEFPQNKLAVITDTQMIRGRERKARKKRAVPAGARLGSYEDLKVGDLVVHEVHGIGRFVGIFRMPVDGAEKDFIKIAYAGTDSLYVPATQLDMVAKYIGAGEDSPVKLSKLGGTDWTRARSRAKAAAKEMAGELIQLYAARQNAPGYAFAPDSPWQKEFEDAFEYDETEDQLRCVAEIKADMEKPVPMDRLLCGDVGYGKTEVALRAVMKCVLDGKQAAILVPTTVLAGQHYQTATSRFFGYPVKIGMLSRFSTRAQANECLAGMADGSVDIVIGTHRLLQKDIKFKSLGLLVVDEEQRFGVSHKEHIKEMTKQVDVLTLSATPIPRTLNMALSGIRDMSAIEEPPSNRVPVQTFVMEHDWNVVCEAIRKEISRGGQVYYLHNRVDTIDRTAARLMKMLPEVGFTVAHGRMDERTLSESMDKMTNGEADVLVCTTIIETGIDIPNVNTLIIEDADHLGLAQLHQLRGRVGRSSRNASAYLTFRKNKVLTEIAEKRLEAIREFAEFNSGIRIAMRDLEIRGAGNLLGSEQSGHLIDVGYDMYLKLLDEAVREAKGEPAETHSDCSADLSVSAGIPEEYIPSAEQRMDIYRRIALVRTEEEADDLTDEICDRFGDPPAGVNELIQVALLRGEAAAVGICDIEQKGNALRFVFSDFRFEAVSALYAEPEWKGRIKVEAGGKPAVAMKLLSRRRITEEARRFVQTYREKKDGNLLNV